MFKKAKQNMAKTPHTETPAINIIRKGTTIVGDITCTGDIRIDGTVNGNLNVQGKVVVGNSGVIDGQINCKTADVSGNIKAKIEVKELLQLKSTANILGDIHTGKLSIEPGANFTGSCSMGAVVKGINHEAKTIEEAQTA